MPINLSLGLGLDWALMVGGGAATLPQSTGIVARWSADTITPQADNTSLASWTDSVGGVVAAQGTGASQPKYRTARLGGKPSVQFTGTTYLPIATPGALKTTVDSKVYTVMIVFNNAGVANTGNLISAQTAGGNQPIWFCDGAKTGRYNSTNYQMATAHTGAGFTVTGTTAWAAGKYGGNTPVERSYINGTCFASSITAPPASTLGWSIGAGSTGTLPVIADIYEIVVWNTPLTAAEVLAVQKFFCDKYSQPYPWAGLSAFRVIDGDSLSCGVGGGAQTNNTTYYYGAKLAASLGLTFGQYTTTAIGSYSLPMMNTKAVAEIDGMSAVTGKPTRLMAFEWYNTRLDADPAGKAQAYIQARKAAGISQLMWGTSVDDMSHSANRDAYNAAMVANAVTWGADALVQLHTDTSIGINGACPAGAPFTPNFYTDGLHLLAAGYTILANLWQTADAGMPAP